ncbi:hypothetical protein KHA93_10885 [Bacillus sp. FJAT-49732]|uniref:WYL domain-containing protein n=1 Tax=Lederbergia citrisecunda TaxID=2833583 RepID=A0A942YLZ3_9BACI|nr:hypothetical protein [Lederbergia citrisecunda]MBS4200135.1 hypothetical protein [Lederbergia citrisecunda]
MRKLLAESLTSGIKLEMIYLSDKKVLTQRTIKVLAIGESSFKAFCYLRGKQRLFKIDNILSIAVPRKKFSRGA